MAEDRATSQRPERETDTRFVYGPRPVGALMPAVTRPVFRRVSPATAQVLVDWPAIVGPALAAVTMPRRLVGGLLTIACAGPVAMELQHLSTELMGRINGHLGQQVVLGLRFVQTQVPPPAPAQPPTPEPAIEPELPGIPEGPLRQALAALGRALLGEAGARQATIQPSKPTRS